VSRANKLIALLLVALWLPATLHCQLESLGLEAIFACADHPAETAHASGDGCTDQGCLTIESGQFALTKSQLDLSCPPAPGRWRPSVPPGALTTGARAGDFRRWSG
jgi:hypothetical protein